MRSVADVELATLGWIDSYNHRRLRRALDYRPPAEYEGEQTRKIVLAPARDSMNRVSTKLGGGAMLAAPIEASQRSDTF